VENEVAVDGVGPVRYMTISVHGEDHFGTTTSVHIGVQLRYTERTLYVPFRYIHLGTFSNTGVNNDLRGRYIFNPPWTAILVVILVL